MRIFEKVHIEPGVSVERRPFMERLIMRGGYGGYTRFSYIAITVFNVLAALLLIFCALPLFLAVGFVIYRRDSGPVFYRGARLGFNKRIFFMCKFRTLPVGTQKSMGARLMPQGTTAISTFSRFLRDTRIDELPQLFNILLGDMDFIGPRPERPEIYAQMCSGISNYDKRFNVRPGLIGCSQLFTPHSSPKKIRTLIDNRYLARPRKLSVDIFLILFTIGVVIRETFTRGRLLIRRKMDTEVLRRYTSKRSFERIRVKGGSLFVSPPIERGQGQADAVFEGEFVLVDMNDQYLKAFSNDPLPVGDFLFRLEKTVRKSGRSKRKRALCRGTLHREASRDSEPYRHAYVVRYHPVSPLNQFMVDHYFLEKSFARCNI